MPYDAKEATGHLRTDAQADSSTDLGNYSKILALKYTTISRFVKFNYKDTKK
jgi:hypothetical protein